MCQCLCRENVVQERLSLLGGTVRTKPGRWIPQRRKMGGKQSNSEMKAANKAVVSLSWGWMTSWRTVVLSGISQWASWVKCTELWYERSVSIQLNSHLDLRGFGGCSLALPSVHHRVCCLFPLFFFYQSFWVWHPGSTTNRCSLAFPRIFKISLHFCNVSLICKLSQLFLTGVVDCFSLFPDWYMNLPLSFTWKYLHFLTFLVQCIFFPLIICSVECNRTFVCLP